MKKIFWIFLLICFITPSALAETIRLKNGGKIEGRIIERSDEYIKIDFQGIVLTYWLDEIDPATKEAYGLVSIKPEAEQGDKKNFLWKVTSDSSIVYLLGSIHVARDDLYPLDRQIEEAFSESDTLVVEVNISDADSEIIQEKFIARGFYLDDSTLKERISADTFKRTQKKLEDLGKNIDNMNKYKPWFLAFTLVTFELAKLGFDADKGIDQYFLGKATEAKNILDLETIDYQLNLFDNLSDEQQELFLISTLVEADILEQEMERLVKAWRIGDAGSVSDILQQGLKKHPELEPIYEKVFYERNNNMSLQIEEFLKSGHNYFVVVGAGHLVGPKGIIQLLKNKGYSIFQI